MDTPTVSDLIAALSQYDGDKCIAPVVRYDLTGTPLDNEVILHVFDDLASGMGDSWEIARFPVEVQFLSDTNPQEPTA